MAHPNLAGRPGESNHMKLKLDAAGAAVLQEVNGVKMPVYVSDDGKESPFDAAATVASINSRAEQAKRVESEIRELKLKVAQFAGIEDPAAALKALELAKTMEHKKLVDAGEVDKVRNEINSAWDVKFKALQKTNEELNETIFSEKIGGAFTRSKAIAEKFAVPADMVQARFGQHFGVDDGKLYATDSAGNKLYSPSKPGVLADFDEAIMLLVDQYPYKDTILKGTGASGGGSQQGGGGGAGGKRTITRAQFDALGVVEKATAAKEAAIID